MRRRPLNLSIRTAFPQGSPLVQDYLQAGEISASFFQGHFSSSESYMEKAREVGARFGPQERERAAELITPSSRKWAPKLEEWLEKGGYFVTTGQQPGLFGGPMYSLYKALTAIRLAEALEGLLAKPVLPLFWVASEDHDWEEADHTHLLDVENQIRTFRLPPPEGTPHRPLFRIPLGSDTEATVEEFIQTLPESDFSPPLFTLIRDGFSQGSTLPKGFLSTLRSLLSEFPIFFVDAADEGLKEASLPLLFQELGEAEAHETILTDTASRLEEGNHGVQVTILEDGANLFLEGPEGRDRIYRDGQGYRLHRSGMRLTEEEIRSQAEEDPSILSPNVLLRPVVESGIFPTLAYVAGPGEMAYFAQLGGLFDAFGIGMPIVHPRHSALLIESKIEKVLEKFHLEPEALDRPLHELAGDLAAEEMPAEVRRALGELRGAIGKGAGELTKAVQEVDPTLKGPVGHARNVAFSALGEVEKKILQAVKRENEIALEQMEKAQRHLFPLGKPQERVLNPFYYLTRYGPELISALLAEFHIALGTDSA